MSLGGFRFSPGFSSPAVSVSEAPSELFPDPTLAHVADGTDGWTFADGPPFMGPTGGTGPGISVDTTFFTPGELVGADKTAFDASVGATQTVSVSLTFANFVTGSVFVNVRGGEVEYAPSGNGVVTHDITGIGGSGFVLGTNDGNATFDITAISVTAV